MRLQVISDSNYTELTSCLACTSSRLLQYLDLTDQPLANSFIHQSEEIIKYPLSLNVCKECFHSQLSIAVDPSILFRNYLYVSGTTTTLLDYFDWFTKNYIDAHGKELKVLDIASNDGSLLKVVRMHGHLCLGIDPAANLMPLAAENEVATICDFWPGQSSKFLKDDFDIVIGMNVFAHIANPVEFLRAAAAIIKSNGKVLIQTSQAMMVRNTEFDTAYHEHLSFFNVSSMKKVAARAGVYLVDVELTAIHGISYLWTFQNTPAFESPRLLKLEQEEKDSGLTAIDTYLSFGVKAELVALEVKNIVEGALGEGYEVWGYGAAAKGNTFINFSEIKLSGIVDDNPLKQGLNSPGGNILVYPPEHLSKIKKPICFVIPAWNFASEITEKIKAIRPESSDMLLTYFPKVEYKPIRSNNLL